MTSTCLIWSTRLGGWVSVSGGTSEWKEARKFDEADALAFCKKQKDHLGTPVCFPVPLYLIEAL